MEAGKHDSSCPLMPTVMESVVARASERCIPLFVHVELTRRCNLRCVHCYHPRHDDVSLDFGRLEALFHELRREGALFVSLTGGEPLCREDFFEILDAASEQSFAITLQTNGTLLDVEVAKRLARYPGIQTVRLSFYGTSENVHDAVTGVDGSLRLTLRALDLLCEHGVRAEAAMMVMKSNVHEVGAFLEMCDRRGVRGGVDLQITPRYDGDVAPLSLRVGYERMVALYGNELSRFLPAGVTDVAQDGGGSLMCNAAVVSCAVSAEGDVYPCIAVPMRCGNVYRESFGRIWRDSRLLNDLRRLEDGDFEKCATCDVRWWCSPDRGSAFLLTGSFTGVDPWTCLHARARREAALGRAAEGDGCDDEDGRFAGEG